MCDHRGTQPGVPTAPKALLRVSGDLYNFFLHVGGVRGRMRRTVPAVTVARAQVVTGDIAVAASVSSGSVAVFIASGGLVCARALYPWCSWNDLGACIHRRRRARLQRRARTTRGAASRVAGSSPSARLLRARPPLGPSRAMQTGTPAACAARLPAVACYSHVRVVAVACSFQPGMYTVLVYGIAASSWCVCARMDGGVAVVVLRSPQVLCVGAAHRCGARACAPMPRDDAANGGPRAGEHQVLAQGLPQLSVTAKEPVCPYPAHRNPATGACTLMGAGYAMMAL